MTTPKQLERICLNDFSNSKWVNDKCLVFIDVEKSFRDAQLSCDIIFDPYGIKYGRLYEPRDSSEFEEVYKMAQDFTENQSVTVWLGMNDIQSEGSFVYNSYQDELEIDAPWGGKY